MMRVAQWDQSHLLSRPHHLGTKHWLGQNISNLHVRTYELDGHPSVRLSMSAEVVLQRHVLASLMKHRILGDLDGRLRVREQRNRGGWFQVELAQDVTYVANLLSG
jgi:hypothetical protein